MRIGPNISDLPGVSASRSEKTSSAPRENAGVGQASEPYPEDMVSLGSLKAKALQTPEVREDKVANLQQSVANGHYRLDPAAIAAAMQEEEPV